MDEKQNMLVDLLQMLAKTREEELDCGEAFDLLDEFVEAAAQGEDVAELMPMVLHHLDICRDCFEEYDALLKVIESEIVNE